MHLKDQIEIWRQNMIAAHEQETALVEELGEAMFDADAALRSKIEKLTVETDARRGDIVRSLQKLASRIGHYPPVDMAANMPPPLPRAPEAPPPQVNHYRQRVAAELDQIFNGRQHEAPRH